MFDSKSPPPVARGDGEALPYTEWAKRHSLAADDVLVAMAKVREGWLPNTTLTERAFEDALRAVAGIPIGGQAPSAEGKG